ncbi:MAG: LPS assembly lipoprotein LptE [Candidatus Omnitrophica bacterium]|nr:LPS assembly lipoprotein LptE [Candidatus Omnitrophota bacterium]
MKIRFNHTIILCIMMVCASGSFFSGCGYTTRSMLHTEYKTIFITPFTSKIDITRDTSSSQYKVNRPMLDTAITKAVSNKFLFDGNLKPVKAGNANLVLKGDVVEFRRDPVRYTDNEDVEEYRLNLVVNISMWDETAGKILWTENGFTGDTTYFVKGTQAKSEDVAINDAIDDLARRIVERTVEQW